MKIVVCVKVIDGEINPFDECAVECALRLSDDVTVLSMGPEHAGNVLKPLTRLGINVILLSDKLYAGSDSLVTAYILSEAIKKIGFDLIICGVQSVDSNTAQVGSMICANLHIPVITNVIGIDNSLNSTTRFGSTQIILPSVITVEREYYLRFPSIKSKQKDITVWDNSIVGCDASKCGLNASPTRVLKTFESDKGKRKCEFVEFSELMPLIDELKRRQVYKYSGNQNIKKLDEAWVIGEKPLQKAQEIAEKVKVIYETSPEKIAALARENKPEVILWNADLWGRKTAPQVAALLNTGLCADCTSLGTENGRLIMYRPAQGGNITAKIKCVSNPQMATVRTAEKSEDIIIGAGRGVADKLEDVKNLAKSIGARLGASRGLVDTGKAPYELQIGLTGQNISSKIYIAIGISGAVQHTCAIEGSDFVIAINSDKDARIFDYCDYGIIYKY